MMRTVTYIWQELVFKVIHDQRLQTQIDKYLKAQPRFARFYEEIQSQVCSIISMEFAD